MATITAQYKGDMLSEVQIGNHALTIDVPAEMGGKDRGPTPPQIFIASIASCISAFVANYCKTAGLNAEGMSVSVSFEKAEKPIRLVGLKGVIRLPNCDPGNRAKAILHVAHNCPVHRTILEMGSEMDITLES